MKKAIGIFLIFLGCVAPLVWYLIWKFLLGGADDAVGVTVFSGFVTTVICLISGGVIILDD